MTPQSRKFLERIHKILVSNSLMDKVIVDEVKTLVEIELGPKPHPLFGEIKKGHHVLMGHGIDDITAVGLVTSVGDSRATVLQYNGGKGRLTIRRDGSAAYYIKDTYLMWTGLVPKDCQGQDSYQEAIHWITDQMHKAKRKTK